MMLVNPNLYAVGTAYDPARRGTEVSLSDTNKTVSRVTVGSASPTVLSLASNTAGNVYWEDQAVQITNTGRNLGHGIALPGYDYTTFIGGVGSFVWFGQGGAGVNAGAIQANGGALTVDPKYNYLQGQRRMFALNRSLGYIWFGNQGSWIDGDPATGLNPSLSGIAPGAWNIAASLQGSQVTTLKTSRSEWLYPPPASFGVFSAT